MPGTLFCQGVKSRTYQPKYGSQAQDCDALKWKSGNHLADEA